MDLALDLSDLRKGGFDVKFEFKKLCGLYTKIQK